MTAALDPDIWKAAPRKDLRTNGWQAGARRWPAWLLAMVLIVALVGLAVATLFSRTDPQKHKSVIQIALLAPPLPPPPPPKPPDTPKPKDEIKIEQPKLDPDEAKTMAEDSPPGLGIDAAGSGPGDSFGLAGRPGGRDIIASSGGGGMGWNLVGAGAARHIAQDLARDPRLKSTPYRIEIRVWLGKDGEFQREEIVRGTGDKELDTLIEQGLHQLSALHQTIPEHLPQPLRIRVTSSDA